MTTVVLSILGLIIGGMVADEEGLIIGLFIGLVVWNDFIIKRTCPAIRTRRS
ncbi:MAG: hypothetical protein Q9N32_00430 [Gammaproteobacteria bacterium]|nr:hypothetical protein [Gammaproteobacteria bacterium]